MTTSIVICRILLTADQKFGVEELTVIASTNLINRGGIEVDEDGPWDIFALASLCEESLERTSFADVLGLGIRATISFEAMLKQITL